MACRSVRGESRLVVLVRFGMSVWLWVGVASRCCVWSGLSDRFGEVRRFVQARGVSECREGLFCAGMSVLVRRGVSAQSRIGVSARPVAGMSGGQVMVCRFGRGRYVVAACARPG